MTLTHKTKQSLGTRLFFIYLAGGVLAWLVFGLEQRANPGWPVILTLLALAMLAEFLPVQLSRHGLRISLTLPFIVGMASAAGPLAALIADLLVSLAAGIVLTVRTGEKPVVRWLCANLAVSLCSAGSAGIAMSLPEVLGASPPMKGLAANLIFTSVYVVVNFLLVTHLNGLISNLSFSENVLKSLKPGAIGLALYGLIGVCVSLLIRDGLYEFTPLMMAPVLALRSALQMKARMHDQHEESMIALTLMLQRAHPYTHGHLERVSRMAEQVALELGIVPARARQLRAAAVLHDIGKIAIDEEILDKPGRLTTQEYEHVKLHPEHGAEILDKSDQFRDIVNWILYHHERPDGKGYPLGLSGDEIPLESRIIAVTDAFDAMVGGGLPGDHRSYKKKMSSEEALAELIRCSGSQFDPSVVSAFGFVMAAGGNL